MTPVPCTRRDGPYSVFDACDGMHRSPHTQGCPGQLTIAGLLFRCRFDRGVAPDRTYNRQLFLSIEMTAGFGSQRSCGRRPAL